MKFADSWWKKLRLLLGCTQPSQGYLAPVPATNRERPNMTEPVIRLTRPSDINKLQALDLKCYHYPMPLKMWQEYVNGSGKTGQARVVICEVFTTSAGFAMWNIAEDQESAQLLRIGVLPKFRRNGLGRLLVKSCIHDASRAKCERINVIVPDLHCDPGHPDDVSVFLGRVGFITTGKVIHSWRTMYGGWVDGYEFERKIDVFASGL